MRNVLPLSALAIVCALFTGASSARAADDLRLDPAHSKWTYEFTVSDLNWRTGRPIAGWTKNFRPNPLRYEAATTMVTASTPAFVGASSSFFRSFEYLYGAAWSDFREGPEHHWGGGTFGFRYNATNPARRVSLYTSLQGGVGAIDSSGVRYAQATDLTFAYFWQVGLRTRITESTSANVAVMAEHISNGWQTHPSEGIDVSGVALTFSYRPAVRR